MAHDLGYNLVNNLWKTRPDQQPEGVQLGRQAPLLASSTCQSVQRKLEYCNINQTIKFILNIWKNLWAQITSSWLWPRNQINDQHLWDPESIKIHQRQVHPPCEAHGQWQTPFQSCRQGALAWTTSPSCQRLSRQWAWSGSTLCSSSDCISTSRFCSSVSFLGPRITWQGFPPVLRVNDSKYIKF